jgi:YidC/Oxa1 family membrane protein insertase
MDQKRLIMAIALSVAIIAVSQFLLPHAPRPTPEQAAPAQTSQGQTSQGQPGTAPRPSNTIGATPQDAGAAPVPPPREVPRLPIDGPRVKGSISLVGARLDDLVLKDYRETIDPTSPLVRVLEPQVDPQPYYVQFGWSAPAGASIPLPGNDTLWTASGGPLAPGKPVTLSWDNGHGLTFRLVYSLDDNYMFSVKQEVANASAQPVALFPWSRIRRDYTPETQGYYILHEGLLGWLDGRLRETKYSAAKSEGEKHNGVASEYTGAGGWAGITDKYWLTALIPDQSITSVASFRHIDEGGDRYQVDFVTKDALPVAAGGQAHLDSRLFVGAKEVHLLTRYETQDGIPSLSYAVDFGWFWFLTKPFFYAIDWLNGVLGNFGLAILVFTICVKTLFFPLANKSYRSMSKMKLLGPKMTALREQYKDDPAKLQQQMMQLYKNEKVNPASGCLPMVIQIPVFFSLYKVIFTTIEMRHAPFFGWIHDLSAIDPTNVFNLFGLLPFDPTLISPMLHLGAWPLVMGLTMFFQQKLNPPPPDPVQAKIFQFMPLIFTFMLARFPAGLVIYWSWNNLLTIGQQWLIMRQTRLANPRNARA